MYRFPTNIYDDPQALLNLLGTFWAEDYSGNSVLEDIGESLGRLTQETLQDVENLEKSRSRFKVELDRRLEWVSFSVLQSTITAFQSEFAKYDGKFDYSEDNGLQYGVSFQSLRFAVQSPSFKNVAIISSGVTSGGTVLFRGADFKIENNLLLFEKNPFDRDELSARNVTDEQGNIIDKEIQFWAAGVTQKKDWLQQQFGYTTKHKFFPDETGKSLLNSAFNCWTTGTTELEQKKILALQYQIPLVLMPEEVVEHIETGTHTQIITDRNVYTYPGFNAPVVEVGDLVRQGDCLTDSLRVFEANRGQSLPDWLDFVTIDPRRLPEGFSGSLSFENSPKSVINHGVVNGYTKISFEIGGNTPDVQLFWKLVHSRGIAAGKTLAMLLNSSNSDKPIQVGEFPLVNPAEVLFNSVFRNNTVLFRVQVDPQNLRQSDVRTLLKEVSPPHVNFITIVDHVISDKLEGLIEQFDEDYNLVPVSSFGDTLVLDPKESYKLKSEEICN